MIEMKKKKKITSLVLNQ